MVSISQRGHFSWPHWVENLMARSHKHSKEEAVDEGEIELLDEVNEAKFHWQCLHNLFNEASDPRVVEHIIHQIIATEKRYGYLLQLAKEQNIRCSEIDIR